MLEAAGDLSARVVNGFVASLSGVGLPFFVLLFTEEGLDLFSWTSQPPELGSFIQGSAGGLRVVGWVWLEG